MKLGNSSTAFKLGSINVAKIMLGTKQVYPTGVVLFTAIPEPLVFNYVHSIAVNFTAIPKPLKFDYT